MIIYGTSWRLEVVFRLDKAHEMRASSSVIKSSLMLRLRLAST
jgi:hypothetical protein